MQVFFNSILGAILVSSGLWANQISEVQTTAAPKIVGPYSQAVRAGQYLFVSGQLGVDPNTGKLLGNTIEEQTRQALNNVEAILQSAGLSLKHVVRADVYLKDMNDVQGMNAVYAERFSQAIKPARTSLQVASLPHGGLVEITCIAFIITQEVYPFN